MQGDVLSVIENKAQNYLINGDFAIDQRLAGGLHTVDDAYSIDRWIKTGGTSLQRVSVSGQTFDFALELVGIHNFIQKIERQFIKHLVGKEVTFSIKAKLISGTATVPQLRVAHANALDNWVGQTILFTEDMDGGTVIGDFKTFKKTFIVTQLMADNGFYVRPFYPASATVQYAQAMLNEGAHAAKFQLASKSPILEQELCQRYYEKSYDVNTAPATITTTSALRFRGSTTNAIETVRYRTTKRTIPIVTIYNNVTGATASIRDNNALANRVANSLNSGTKGFAISLSASVDTNDHSGHFTADAEL